MTEGGSGRFPEWRGRDARFDEVLGVVETVKHHFWNDVNDWRVYRHGESHIAAEGYNV